MSLLGRLSSIIPAPGESELRAGSDASPDTGLRDQRRPNAILLIYNDPEAPSDTYGLGWTLTAWRGAELQWSVALEAHGVGLLAEARVAKAVAARVLLDRGVRVEDWSEDVVEHAESAPSRTGHLNLRHDPPPAPGTQRLKIVEPGRLLQPASRASLPGCRGGV